ncbi:Wzz/FepE/Etk N-terminal domain-containing protein [Mucilaginibacter sp. KACC 22063]|uniref:Wzz/FepE/Etk N-terminal domain-containing protein n=1 Tax=Mucilaginibacter sp. KACC 22063 TaxID=3025666 RepID=UPI002366F9A8|nr:Wzz/FepE/Etk N-terminal domain-containing protein [Mucilaginibacter sp. KACC 22063]WDF53688.1 Wzz/FepE/Etk N-terminal domain-containing protein [Mucilaginibacter sp. KACC 22063]
MELSNFFRLLIKNKYTLIIIPLVAIIITYFLVRNQPDLYTSQAQIATGIVDQTQQSISQQIQQDSRISQEFSNLIELIRSKKMLDQVSYQLMIHDLKSAAPYRKPSKLLSTLNQQAKQHALQVYSDMYAKKQSLSLFNEDQRGLYQLMSSMKYDDQSLLKTLTVYRTDNSDFIVVQADSDNPELSATIVNNLCSEAISYYNMLIKENQQKAVTFLGELLKAKQDSMNKRMQQLKDYKIQNHVFNLNEQARSLYGEIADFETRLEQNKKDAIANQQAVKNIDSKFDPSDRQYIESTLVKINQNIVGTRAQLEAANNRYVQSGFDQKYKSQVDSLSRRLSAQVNQSTDKLITSPLTTKQNLIEQKLTLQIQADLAKNSISSIQTQLDALNQRLYKLVPHEAVIQADESAITVASQEYLDILQKYNQTSLESNFTARLRRVQQAMPGMAQPSKKMLLVILSGIISFVFCVAVFFVIFLLDTSIKNPRELANKTKTPVMGYLNQLHGAVIDLNKVWNERDAGTEVALFRSLLQSVRFEIDTELKGDKILLVNSIKKGEGKTYVTMNLAYAYAAINKKVLVIDGNFINPDITELSGTKNFIEDYFKAAEDTETMHLNSKINILGNKGGGLSVLEIADSNIINRKLNALKSFYDIIIIEASALDTLNRSKEWILYAEKIVAIFEAGQSFKQTQQLNLEYLKAHGNKFVGWVMNMVSKEQLQEPPK